MVALASDHAGFVYKERTKELLGEMGVQFEDLGPADASSTDYPDWAHKAARAVSDGRCEYGILICGTGIGMSIVANKHKGVRAALCTTTTHAKLARRHNNANVLTLGERTTGWEIASETIRTFLTTEFEGGRHQRRVDKIHSLTGA